MTVLGKDDIERSIGYGDLKSHRGVGNSLAIEPASMDVHLGSEIAYTNHEETVDVADPETYPEYSYAPVEHARLLPKEFWLATTEERIEVPNDKIGFLHGRSSVGRLGPFIHNAGLLDPGFRGQITLEIFNAARYPIQLHESMRIAQVTFHDLETAPDVGYSEHNGNKYNGQTGPTPSRLWEDFE